MSNCISLEHVKKYKFNNDDIQQPLTSKMPDGLQNILKGYTVMQTITNGDCSVDAIKQAMGVNVTNAEYRKVFIHLAVNAANFEKQKRAYIESSVPSIATKIRDTVTNASELQKILNSSDYYLTTFDIFLLGKALKFVPIVLNEVYNENSTRGLSSYLIIGFNKTDPIEEHVMKQLYNWPIILFLVKSSGSAHYEYVAKGNQKTFEFQELPEQIQQTVINMLK